MSSRHFPGDGIRTNPFRNSNVRPFSSFHIRHNESIGPNHFPHGRRNTSLARDGWERTVQSDASGCVQYSVMSLPQHQLCKSEIRICAFAIFFPPSNGLGSFKSPVIGFEIQKPKSIRFITTAFYLASVGGIARLNRYTATVAPAWLGTHLDNKCEESPNAWAVARAGLLTHTSTYKIMHSSTQFLRLQGKDYTSATTTTATTWRYTTSTPIQHNAIR